MNTSAQYSGEVGTISTAKKLATSPTQLVLVEKYVAMVPGRITMEKAKMSGIIPAELILSGRYVAPLCRYILPPPEYAAPVLHRDAPVGLIEQHDERDNQHADDGEETDAQHVVPVKEALGQEAREPGHDAGKDYQRDSVADASLGYHLAQPHQEHRAGGDGEQRRYGGQSRVAGEAHVGQHVALLEQHQLAVALSQSDRHGNPVDDAVHRCPARFSLPRQFLKLGNHRGQQLNHDGRGDIGKDAQGDDTHTAEGAAAEQVQESQHLVVAEEVVELNLVNARQRYMGDKAVQGQDSQGEQYLGSKVRDTECVYGRL